MPWEAAGGGWGDRDRGLLMGLREDILKEPVTKLLVRDLISVSIDTPARKAAALMRQKGLGCVAVVDQEGKPLGKFTEREFLRLLNEDPAKLDQPVKECATNVRTVGLNDPITDLLLMMQEHGVRFACVVDEHGKAVGLTGQKGVMQYIGDHFPRLVKAQQMDSKVAIEKREGA